MDGLTRLADWTVPPDEIDHLGHMSTLFYTKRAADAADGLLERLGASPAALAEAGLVVATVDRHMLFRREQLVDAPLYLAGEVVGAEPDQIELYEEMGNARSGETAAMFRLGLQLQRRESREAVAVPEPWLAAARARRVAAPARSEARSLPLARMGVELTVADFVRAGVQPHLSREVPAEACDAGGFLKPVAPRLAPIGESWNQGVMDQVWGSVDGFVWPALEMRTVARRTPRAGDVLETYAALLSVGHKIIHSGVWVFEARSQALVQVTHQVNIFFRLAARRPQDMEPEVRERLSRLITPGLIAEPGH